MEHIRSNGIKIVFKWALHFSTLAILFLLLVQSHNC